MDEYIQKNIIPKTVKYYPILLLIGLFTFFISTQVKAQERCPVDDSLTVYIFMLEDCLLTQFYTVALKELYQEYRSYNIEFVGLFPNSFSKREKIDSFQFVYQIPFPLKTDYFQTKTKRFGANVTPEIVIYNHTYDEVWYQGRIDNTYYKVGKKRGKTTTSDLRDALESIVRGEPIAVPKTEAVGCLINLKP